MFTLNITYDTEEGVLRVDRVIFRLNYHGLILTFEPEDVNCIKQLDPDHIDRLTFGNAVFDRKPNRIILGISKEGDGAGAQMTIELPPALIDSFRNCLRKWKKAVTDE